ncbi:ABC-F family ATP-binding cassette domain-containing protein [Phaeodactylibacter sp.]|uniref:ABC-F family ATP-binding cassette domain-containing protein n=1 Tax=Phaeodactylibacter sp. TaxID=1940289 RepID=UPI0025D48DCB|nr:ABC-F family ATP-binding cassette domain-containing protein [Phaeodactylibacter sp.]MCI4647404.1 ABC-F family ATP-binding cassette domain-containing protein [Phaeodactylibacter sp.]MCI5090010.1 ABC-F family ATP-binding cassette domain-containing protein [Phaeodactylibacter sp.]
MNYLNLEDVTKMYGEKVLFDNISLQVNQGQKIALVAKNGSGKTTLLRVIAGEEAPEGEAAKVYLHKDVRIGFLNQDPEFFEEHTILEAVLDSENAMIQAVRAYEYAMLFPDDTEAMHKAIAKMDALKAWDFEARIREVLTKLEVSDLNKLVKNLSGGQKKRLALAKLIIEEPEFLILDEPTNHLDLDMIEWLEEYLQQPRITLFMVTHDRYFLERVCDIIVELDLGKLYRYTGNYSEFLEKKTTRHDVESATLEKSKKLLKRELDWVRRMPKARGTKAKSRVDAFHDLKDEVSQQRIDEEMKIDIKGQRLGKKVLEAHNISKAYDNKVLVDGFTYKFRKGERAGIVGPNGVGKSTFLKLLTNEIRTDSGKVVVGGNTVFGYYTQDGIQLKENKRVIDVVQDIAEFIPLEKGQKLTAPQLLERFMFNRKQQQVYVSELSGGERRRLYLLTVLMANPNFLILDEPTNDLDIMTLNVLEDFLMDFPGCVLIVSHDRYFMDKIVEHLFVFEGNGKIRDFPGSYTRYREVKKEEDREKARLAKEAEASTPAAPKPKSKATALSQDERKELKRLEKKILKLEEKKAELTEQFNDTSLSPEQITDLSKELSDVNDELEELELRWMELAEMA